MGLQHRQPSLVRQLESVTHHFDNLVGKALRVFRWRAQVDDVLQKELGRLGLAGTGLARNDTHLKRVTISDSQ